LLRTNDEFATRVLGEADHAGESRFASRAITHLPSGFSRKIESVCPARRIGCPFGGVIVTASRVRHHAQSPWTASGRASGTAPYSPLSRLRIP